MNRRLSIERFANFIHAPSKDARYLDRVMRGGYGKGSIKLGFGKSQGPY
jgi:hypothetical protein